MLIRKATLSDANDIAEIHTESWRNTYQNALSSEYLLDVVPEEREKIWNDRFLTPKTNQVVFVAEIKEKIVGFVCIYGDENPKWGSYLDNLHVIKEFHSQGIGKALLVQAMSWCSNKCSDKGMCLLVNQDNLKAQHFYKTFGATNAEESVWNAPDGSVVPTYWFVWGARDIRQKYG